MSQRVLSLVAGGLLFAACALQRQVDLNSAPVQALEDLPGMTAADAGRIVANRPYATKDDLVRRRVVDPDRYAAIRDHLYVGPPGMPDYLEALPPQAEAP